MTILCTIWDVFFGFLQKIHIILYGVKGQNSRLKNIIFSNLTPL